MASIKRNILSKVNLIIWFYYEGNDLAGLGYETENKTLKNYLTNREFSQNLKNKQEEIDELVEKKILTAKDTTFKFKRFFET